MNIVFDDQRSTPPAPRATPRTSIDDIKAAERSVAFAKGELARAVAEVQALDGLSGWVSWLTGNHEADVQRALAQVKHCQGQLSRAEAHHGRIVQAHTEEQRRERATQEVAIQRLMQLEMVADTVRARGGPTATELADLEERIAEARTEADDLEAVFGVGMALRGQLGRALRAVKQADHGATMDTMGMTGGGLFKAMALRTVQTELDGVPERTARFQQACEVIGLDIRLGDGVGRVHRAAKAALTDAFFDNLFADMLTSRRIRDALDGLQAMCDDVDAALLPVVDRRKEASQTIEALEQAREALLER